MKVIAAAPDSNGGIDAKARGDSPSPVSQVADLVSEWRKEVDERPLRRKGDKGPQDRCVDRASLEKVFTRWATLGLDLRLLAYVVLGSEWLFRARRATESDVEAELAKL